MSSPFKLIDILRFSPASVGPFDKPLGHELEAEWLRAQGRSSSQRSPRETFVRLCTKPEPRIVN